MGIGWDFYIVVGASLFIAFLMAYLGWRQDKADKAEGQKG